MPRRPSRLVLLFVLLTLASVARAQSLEAQLKEIDDYATKAGRDWNVPGFAIAIVKDDRVVFAKGYGVRELGKPAPVDEKTLFAIASNTKAFTAASIAILVDEGKVKWDDPVTKYLPEFQLSDPYVTREMTLRDLLSHRSGLATFGGDLLWYESNYDRREILRRIRFLKPTSSFRSRFGYQNIMFLAAGEVVAAVTGKSWDDFVREHFFVPLGMTTTQTSVRQFKPTDNVATPHNEVDGRLRVIRYSMVDGVGGAAAINSNVAEMAQWLRLQLGRGLYEGKQFFSPAVAREMWTPHTIIPISEQGEKLNPTRHFYTYGLGWFLSDYHGRKVASHGGGLDGMISQVAMMPEEKLGVVILSNSETPLPSFMANKVFDVFLGVPQRDWSAELLTRTKAAKEAERGEEQKLEAERAKDTKPSLALEKYAGTYTGAMYGDAKVVLENGRLVLRLTPSPNFVGDLEHWQYDTFRVKWRDSIVYPFPKGFVTFTLDAHGQVDAMKIDVPNPDFDFKELEFKRAQEAMKAAAR
ncbi:MAG TPA: serine hydrolase [Pyrinomonadaceae bacterium]|jgi:CubicO group peptidase (beta-lactamase class C family)